MEIKQIRFFAAIAQQGSFTKASAVLSVAQPILSRQMKLLETELGTRLFYRNGRGIVLTEPGIRLVEHAERLLAAIADCDEALDDVRGEPAGRLAIGLPPSVARCMAVPLVRQLRETMPLVSISIVEGFAATALAAIQANELDAGIVYDAEPLAGLTLDPIMDDEHYLIGPLADMMGIGERMVDVAEMASLPLVIAGGSTFIDPRFAELARRREAPIEVNSLTSVLALVESGSIYSILPAAVSALLLKNGNVRRWQFSHPPLTRRLNLVRRDEESVSIKTERLIAAVREQLRAYEQMSLDARAVPNVPAEASAH